MSEQAKGYLSNYYRLKEERDKTQGEMDQLANTYANITCPYKIGEVVKILGYVYAGKKGRIKKICAKIQEWDEKEPMIWIVSGPVLRKDGSEGEQQFDFSKDDWDD
jgi:ribosomal protein S28E/S33